LAIVCAGTGDINTELLFEKELGAIRTNVVGWTAAVDCIYNHFKQQDKGHLVTITSIGGLAGEPAAPAYSATKAYQINYTQALRKKSKKTGIWLILIWQREKVCFGLCHRKRLPNKLRKRLLVRDQR
jgi:short-subunit dehydrogenase